MNASTDHTTDRQGRRYDVRGAVRYRIKTTHRGSSSLGNCYVCDRPADEVFLQVQQRYVVPTPDPILADVVDADGGFWTHHRCEDRFGHEACLISTRN
jgi:hypothetical protein